MDGKEILRREGETYQREEREKKIERMKAKGSEGN
jgi:hypothetical protein